MHLVDAAVYNLQALAERGRNTLKRCFSPVLDSSVPLLRKQEKWSRIQARDEEIVTKGSQIASSSSLVQKVRNPDPERRSPCTAEYSRFPANPYHKRII